MNYYSGSTRRRNILLWELTMLIKSLDCLNSVLKDSTIYIHSRYQSFIGKNSIFTSYLKEYSGTELDMYFWIITELYNIIYFRDFKPQNLLLFLGGTVIKIADMGISRLSTQQSMTEFTGTQLYISPGKGYK